MDWTFRHYFSSWKRRTNFEKHLFKFIDGTFSWSKLNQYSGVKIVYIKMEWWGESETLSWRKCWWRWFNQQIQSSLDYES